MIRRILLASIAVLALGAGRAEAVTIRDIIELSKAGLSDSVLLALIEVDRPVFAIDTATIRKLKEAGVSETVMVAMIRSGREQPEPPPAPVEPQDPAPAPEPKIVVIDHHDPAPAPVAYPVAVPVYVPVATGVADGRFLRNSNVVKATIQTDQGPVNARVPLPANCVKAEPVYWGFGGTLRPGSWQPPPTVVCR